MGHAAPSGETTEVGPWGPCTTLVSGMAASAKREAPGAPGPPYAAAAAASLARAMPGYAVTSVPSSATA